MSHDLLGAEGERTARPTTDIVIHFIIAVVLKLIVGREPEHDLAVLSIESERIDIEFRE